MSYSKQRWSARLAGEPPEITEKAKDCFICLKKVDACKPSTVRLPCCYQFTHRRCQKEWEKNVRTCAHCRSDLLEREDDGENLLRSNETLPPQSVPQEIRDALAESLRNKLNDPDIMRRVRQVSILIFRFSLRTTVLTRNSIFIVGCESSGNAKVP